MSEEEQDFVEIVVDSPLDITKYINLVRNPGAGAIATFIGTTRDTFEGKQVLELRYESYTPMALRRLRAICLAARNRWNLIACAVAHRIGVVPVGEESVFVAVSSVHRRDALEACEYVIDEIKATVPIWKKEVYTNGEVWKENSEFSLRKSQLALEGGEQAMNLEQNKVHKHYGCCARKEKLFDNGHDKTLGSGHWREEVGEDSGKASGENGDCEGIVLQNGHKGEGN